MKRIIETVDPQVRVEMDLTLNEIVFMRRLHKAIADYGACNSDVKELRPIIEAYTPTGYHIHEGTWQFSIHRGNTPHYATRIAVIEELNDDTKDKRPNKTYQLAEGYEPGTTPSRKPKTNRRRIVK